jgi:hypothetical protein
MSTAKLYAAVLSLLTAFWAAIGSVTLLVFL